MERLEDRRMLALLGNTLALPLITYDTTGTLTYDASSQAFDLQARPLQFAEIPAPGFFRTIEGSRNFEIHIKVDNSGNLLGGVPGDDIVLTGDIDINGDSLIDVSGTLLTGEIVEFGYLDVGSGSTADKYDFRFTPTGGALFAQVPYDFYQGKDIGVTTISEESTFVGDFGVGFDGGAKGNIAPIEALAAPASLGDKVFEDTDADGIQEAGEPGIGNVTVRLYKDVDGDGVAEPGGDDGAAVGTTSTNTSGIYGFTGLTPGDYFVEFVKPAGFDAFSPQDQGSDDAMDSDADTTTGVTGVTGLESGETDDTIDAGLFKLLPGIDIEKHVRLVAERGIDIEKYVEVVQSCGICETTGKPTELTFRYDPGSDVITGQHGASVFGQPDDDSNAYLVVTDRKPKDLDDVFSAAAVTYFQGSVSEGTEFIAKAADAGLDRFKSNTFFYVFDDEDAFDNQDAPLQKMRYHTSCSQPIRIGDVIGSVELTGFVGEHGTAPAASGFGLDADKPTGPKLVNGDVVKFNYVVTTEVALSNIVVLDDNGTLGDSSDDFNPDPVLEDGLNVGDLNADDWLDPGEVWLYTAAKTVTEGRHHNIGIVTGDDGTGVTLIDADPARWAGVDELGSDGGTDGGTDGGCDGHSDGGSDGGSDSKPDHKPHDKSHHKSHDKSDRESDNKSDDKSHGKSEHRSHGKSDGDRVTRSDGGSDGGSDGKSDGRSDGDCDVDVGGDVDIVDDRIIMLALPEKPGVDADEPPGPIGRAGDKAIFTYIVTNPTQTPVGEVVVVDDNATPDKPSDDFAPDFVSGDSNGNGLLDPGEKWKYMSMTRVAPGLHENIGTVNAEGGVTDEDPAHWFGEFEAKIDVEKFVKGEFPLNDGDSDGHSDGGSDGDSDGDCNGASEGDSDGHRDEFGFDADTPTGPRIRVDDKVFFTYVVSNPGDVALNDVAIVDDNETPSDPTDDFNPDPVIEGDYNVGDRDMDNLLDPGEVWLYTATSVVTEGQHRNEATATALSTVPDIDGTIEELVDSDPAHWLGISDTGGEGLTPGFWKQPHHFDEWIGFSPNDHFNKVFGVNDPDDPTLFQALKRGGGGRRALARHAVAALLNAASHNVSYSYTQSEVISLVQEAFDTGEFRRIKNLLRLENRLGFSDD